MQKRHLFAGDGQVRLCIINNKRMQVGEFFIIPPAPDFRSLGAKWGSNFPNGAAPPLFHGSSKTGFQARRQLGVLSILPVKKRQKNRYFYIE